MPDIKGNRTLADIQADIVQERDRINHALAARAQGLDSKTLVEVIDRAQAKIAELEAEAAALG